MATAVLVRVNRLLNDREERDGDCLRRFADSHDETAFAELVLRHGPAVYGICRRALGDHQLAEDAFQAVFVILARKAATIRTPDAVGGWLFGVARHVAARGVAMRRRIRKERATGILPECPTEATEPDDAPAILESEIAKLPEALRAAVVLCEIEGLSRRTAATRLGIAEGTLSSRLANARKRLATQLRGRGVAPGLAFVTVALVPQQLAASALSAATASTGLTPSISTLANEGLRMMLIGKLKLTAVMVVCALALSGAFEAWPSQESTAKPPVLRPIKAPIPKPEPREGVILISSFNDDKPLELVKPDGTGSKIIKPEGQFKPWQAKLSPDGKRLLYADMPPVVARPVKSFVMFSIRTLDLEAKNPEPKILAEEAYYPSMAWATDGKSMYYSHIDPDKFDESQKQGEKILFRNSHYDPATDKTTRLKLPPEHAVIAVSPDGQTFVTKTTEFGTFKQSVYLTPLKTMKPELLDQSGSMTLHMVAFSPDGRRILLRKLSPKTLTLTAIDMKTKEETEIIGSIDAGAGMMQDFCWSPDSKRIAYHWHEEIPQPAGVPIPVVPGVKWSASRVTVCDLDGSNSKVIVKREYNETITAIDWK